MNKSYSPHQILEYPVELLPRLLPSPQLPPGLEVDHLVAPQLVHLRAGRLLLQLQGPVEGRVIGLELLEPGGLWRVVHQLQDVVPVLLLVQLGAGGRAGAGRSVEGAMGQHGARAGEAVGGNSVVFY